MLYAKPFTCPASHAAVRVGFDRDAYTFSESDVTASIVVRASNPVASPFTVRVQGGETRLLPLWLYGHSSFLS